MRNSCSSPHRYDDNSGDGGTSIRLVGVGWIADSEMAGIEWTVTGSDVLSFDWKVLSEQDYDVLRGVAVPSQPS